MFADGLAHQAHRWLTWHAIGATLLQALASNTRIQPSVFSCERGIPVDMYRRKKAPLRGLEGERSGKVRTKKSPLAGAF